MLAPLARNTNFALGGSDLEFSISRFSSQSAIRNLQFEYKMSRIRWLPEAVASQVAAGAVAGTEIVVNGGKIDIVRDGGEAPGTQVEVRSLFYNLPARRKFLRSENTESRNIEHQIHLQAIGHSRIGFSLLRDDRMLFQVP